MNASLLDRVRVERRVRPDELPRPTWAASESGGRERHDGSEDPSLMSPIPTSM
jgi:hypothetical protein